MIRVSSPKGSWKLSILSRTHATSAIQYTPSPGIGVRWGGGSWRGGGYFHLYGLLESPLWSPPILVVFNDLRCDEYLAGSGPNSRHLFSLLLLLPYYFLYTITRHPPSPSCNEATPSRDHEKMSTRSSVLMRTLLLPPFPLPESLGLGGEKYQPPQLPATLLIPPWNPAPLLTYWIFSGVAGRGGRITRRGNYRCCHLHHHLVCPTLQ